MDGGRGKTLNTRKYWTAWRVAAWAAFLLLFAAYAHLAFRQDSSFFTVSWMPRKLAWWILKYTDYRNFWAFGFLGFYCTLFLGAWWWVRRDGRWQWGTLAVWLLPVLKEILQIPVPGRHGTLHGTLYGVAGSGLGLILGITIRASVAALWRGVARWRKAESRRVKSES